MLIPSIHFSGNCNEAIEFYTQAVGAKVNAIHYAKDAPGDFSAGLAPNFVMHSEIDFFGTTLSLTDGCENAPTGDNYTFMIMLKSAEEVTDVFNKLADGGTINEPLGPQFWADLYGSLTDKFGVNWSVMIGA